MKRQTVGLLGGLLMGALLAVPAGQSREVSWLTYGGDPGSSKYAPADTITPQNVKSLQIAWQWEHA